MKKYVLLVLIVCLLNLLVSPALVQASGAYILLSQYSGQIGSMTSVTGEGFSPLDTVSIYVGTNPMPMAVTNTSLSGQLGPIAITIPAGVVPETKVDITAKSGSGLNASVAFYVEGYFPTISVSASGNTPFSTVTVAGSGFAPNENIAITMGDFINLSTVSDSHGQFSGSSFKLPMVKADSYIINAQGTISKNKATSYFYVGGFYPNVFPSAFYLIPGQSIKFSGGGFAPGENVQVFAGSTLVSSFTTDSVGAYKDVGTYTIPTGTASGPLKFRLAGELSKTEVTAEVSVGKFNPQVFPSSYFVLPGDILSFSGIDFAPYEAIRVYEGENPMSLNMITADAKGNFPANSLGFKIPAEFASTKRTITIVGEVSHMPLELAIGVGKFTPQLSPSSYYVKPGEKIVVDGWNFMPHEDVDLSINGTPADPVTSNKTGNIKLGPVSIPFHIPNFILSVFGRNSGGKAALNLPVSNYFPTVTAGSYYVKPGDKIWFSGGAFAPGELVNVSVKQPGAASPTTLGTIQTNKDGYLVENSFPVGLKTPTGTSTYTFRGTESDAVSEVKLDIASFVPLISSGNYYPAPGSTIKIWISGFGPFENLAISVNDKPAKTVAANLVGSAGPIELTLPIKQKSAVIKVVGEDTEISKDITLAMSTFSPVVIASTYYTLPGNQISFTGWGFAPNETVSISNDTAVLGSVTADNTGKFASDKFVIPFTTATSLTYSFAGEESEQVNKVKISLGSFSPYVLLSLYYGKADAAETISGFAFAPNEQVSVKFGSLDLGTVTADAKGSFSVNTTVPQGSGTITATATGLSSGSLGKNNFTFATY
ncbi:MAG: hypothetical protein KW788_04385 [Candidatus Doudnabacteria bacterium]|nr:hypothetical protein [Candidatus Doudnabacteria bacterium]